MADIFALQGTKNAGKTSTLIALMNEISADYPNATVQVLHRGTKDVKVIIDPVKGMKIGIESQGDPNSRLQQSLADFRNANCDVVFSACRTSGRTEGYVKAMSPPDNVQFIQQKATPGGPQAEATANAAQVTHLRQLAGI